MSIKLKLALHAVSIFTWVRLTLFDNIINTICKRIENGNCDAQQMTPSLP